MDASASTSTSSCRFALWKFAASVLKSYTRMWKRQLKDKVKVVVKVGYRCNIRAKDISSICHLLQMHNSLLLLPCKQGTVTIFRHKNLSSATNKNTTVSYTRVPLKQAFKRYKCKSVTFSQHQVLLLDLKQTFYNWKIIINESAISMVLSYKVIFLYT